MCGLKALTDVIFLLSRVFWRPHKCVTAKFSTSETYLCLNGFSKMPVLALCEIFKSLCHGKNSIKLELALVRNSRPRHFAACFKILLSLAMFQSLVFSREILKFRKFSNCFQCKPCFKYLHLRFSGNILTRSTVGGLEILIQIILLSARSISWGQRCSNLSFPDTVTEAILNGRVTCERCQFFVVR